MPTLESYVVSGRKMVAQWAKIRFQQRNKPPDARAMPPRPPPEGVIIDEDNSPRRHPTTIRGAKAAVTTVVPGAVAKAAAAAAAAEVGDGGAGGEDWWCVKAAGGNGGLDIWVLHEGNWKPVTEELSDTESYVIQVRTGKSSHAHVLRRLSSSEILPTCLLEGQ